jgi:putative RNA 2'-phosphotransferase
MTDLVKLSKTMAHALRHAPEAYGLTLDADGWVAIEALIAGLQRRKIWQHIYHSS